MKIIIIILCLMVAGTIHPTSATEAENITNSIPSSTERIWTIDGQPHSDLIYLGPQERDGIKYAIFAKSGLGPRTIPLDKLSPADLDVIKEYDRIHESKKNDKH